MLRKVYLLFLIYFQFSLCYEYDSDPGYRQKKSRLAKNVNKQHLSRDYYDSFRRYQNAFEDAAPGDGRGAGSRLDLVDLVRKPEDIAAIDSLYLHKRKLKESNNFGSPRNKLNTNHYNKDYAPNESQNKRKNTMRRDSYASTSFDTEKDDSNFIQKGKKMQKLQHGTVELAVNDKPTGSMRSKFKFPFFSHNIYLNRTEDYKPMKKKPSKRKIYFRIENPSSPPDAPSPTESALNATAALVDNPQYLNKELSKRSYAERLCPVCLKKYLNLEPVAKDRSKRSDETIHNSREFFQLNSELGNNTETVSNSSTEDKNPIEDVTSADAELIDAKVGENFINEDPSVLNLNSKLKKTKRDLTDLLNSSQLVQLQFNNAKQIKEANEIKRHIDSATVAGLIENDDKLLTENSDNAKITNDANITDLKKNRKRKRSLAAIKQRLFDELNEVQSRVEEANVVEIQNNTEEHDNNKNRMKRHGAQVSTAEQRNRNKEENIIRKNTSSKNIRQRRFDLESNKLRPADELDRERDNDSIDQSLPSHQ